LRIGCRRLAALVALAAPLAWAGPSIEVEVRLGERSLADLAKQPAHARYFAGPAAEAARNLDALLGKLRRWYRSLPAARRRASSFAFPATTQWTPARPPCARGARAYTPGATGWEHSTWRTLGFRPGAPHRFQYRLISFGHGKEASFSLQARADLDCNGKLSLYRVSGHARGGELHALLLRMRRPGE